jgi:hypothetical protein
MLPCPPILLACQDTGLLQRPPSNGLPSPTAGAFWSDLSAQEGVVQTLPPYAPAAAAPAAAAGVDAHQQSEPDSSSASDSGSSSSSPAGQQQQQQVVQQQYVAPPLRVAAGAWQQPLQQLLARPVQQLPLLPHLAKPWVKQQTLRFRQQQDHVQQQQAEGGEQLAGLPDGYEQYPGLRQSLGLSGKVLPPLPVLFQRALDIEKQLFQQDVKN